MADTIRVFQPEIKIEENTTEKIVLAGTTLQYSSREEFPTTGNEELLYLDQTNEVLYFWDSEEGYVSVGASSSSDSWRPIKSGIITIDSDAPLEFVAGENVSLELTTDGSLTINSEYTDTTYDIVTTTNEGLAPQARASGILSANSGGNVAWRYITRISGGKASGNNWGQIID